MVKSQDDENLRPQEAATAKQSTLVSEVGQPQRSSVEPGPVVPTFAEEQTMKVPSMEAFAQMAQVTFITFHSLTPKFLLSFSSEQCKAGILTG